MAAAAPVPLRRIEPAERRAAAEAEADHRPLLRPRLRHDRLTEDHAWDSWNTRPRPSRGASST
ncbi:hypothetical protein MICRO8M_80170 [Microbacterium sp. 8M]|nr:hypothetical protein MICRO8M_80170 [Microbacterium sp. 8M]